MDSNLEMPPDLAKKLFICGGFVVLKDFPEGCEFGIDVMSWTVGPKFKGVKMIPPGVHFIYLSTYNAPRISFFHNFKPGEILLRKWNREDEDLDENIPEDSEIELLRANLVNLDSALGPYPYSTYQQWVSLSSYITPTCCIRLSPKNRLSKITSQTEFTTEEQMLELKMGDAKGFSVTDREHPNRIRFADSNGLPLMYVDSSCAIKFSEVQLSSSATNLKKPGIDNSDRLFALISNIGGDYKELLAEFQYAFIVFLMGQVYEGFEQWKRLIHLFSCCSSALKSQTPLFLDLLATIHFQLKFAPNNLFNEFGGENFLVTTLSFLFATIEDKEDINNTLRTKAAKFRALLENKFSRSFTLPNE